MNMIETKLPGAVIIEPKVFSDKRSFFMEMWSKQRYTEADIFANFAQDNLSFSRRGILRSLH